MAEFNVYFSGQSDLNDVEFHANVGAEVKFGETLVAVNGKSPYIGDNGNWFVYDDAARKWVDTGVLSRGDTPHIGDNGHWWIADDDTGVPSTGPAGPMGTAVTSARLIPAQHEDGSQPIYVMGAVITEVK